MENIIMTRKKNILILAIALCLIPLAAFSQSQEYDSTTLFLPKHMSLQEAQSHPKIIAWSNHNVLTKKDEIEQANINIHYAPALAYGWSRYACQKAYEALTGIQGNYLKAYNEINALPHGCSGEAHAQILEKYGLTTIAALTRALSAAKVPYEPAISIVRDLNTKHIDQYLCTNSGLITLDAILKKAHDLGSDLPALLNKGITTHYNAFPSPLSIIDPSRFITTPNYTTQEDFYRDCITTLGNNGAKIPVVINHSQKAIAHAVNAGCIGIVYLTSEQTRNDLRLLGIESE
jgi:hypothetical protein